MYRLALTRAGYEVSIAADGRAGVEAARARRPDFIFLDIRMPGMDGLEVLQALEADAATRGVAVAMLSNYGDGGQVSRSLALGAKEYIVKTSVLPVDLAAVVARWLGAN